MLVNPGIISIINIFIIWTIQKKMEINIRENIYNNNIIIEKLFILIWIIIIYSKYKKRKQKLNIRILKEKLIVVWLK